MNSLFVSYNGFRCIINYLIYFSDVCLELPFILTHPNPESNIANVDGLSEGVDDFQFTEAGRPGDESSGDEAPEVSETPVGPPLAPQVTPNGGGSGGNSRPQMGLAAKRTTGGMKAQPVNSHFAEFMRASEMPDGLAAFAMPPPPSAAATAAVSSTPATVGGVSREPVDVLDSFLGLSASPIPSKSNG